MNGRACVSRYLVPGLPLYLLIVTGLFKYLRSADTIATIAWTLACCSTDPLLLQTRGGVESLLCIP